jgi:hypothetical protein
MPDCSVYVFKKFVTFIILIDSVVNLNNNELGAPISKGKKGEKLSFYLLPTAWFLGPSVLPF